MNLHIFHRQAFVFDFVSFKLSGSLEKCPAFSLLFYPYFSFISETAVSETVVSEIMLMFIV